MTENEILKDLKEDVLEILEDSGIFLKQIDELKEWNSFGEILRNIKLFTQLVTHIILTVDDMCEMVEEKVNSDTKLNIAVDILDKYTVMPFWIDVFDGPILKVVISVIVESINNKKKMETLINI